MIAPYHNCGKCQFCEWMLDGFPTSKKPSVSPEKYEISLEKEQEEDSCIDL